MAPCRAFRYPDAFNVAQLFSPNEQDFLVLTARAITVPEPPAYALMLIALAGLGFVTRRRSQR